MNAEEQLLFQFYLSSIKSNNKGDFNKDFNKFQFYLSSIKSFRLNVNVTVVTVFQFYLSSIKSGIG